MTQGRRPTPQSWLVVTVVFLTLLWTAARAEDSPSYFKSFRMSTADQERLDLALTSAVQAMAPYRNQVLDEDGELPKEVPAFFLIARTMAQEYGVSGGDLLLVPQAFLIRTGRVSPKAAERAFQPLSDLLDEYKVRGDEVLDLVVPDLLTRLEIGLKTPPEKRSGVRTASPTLERRKQGLAFAQKHRIPIPALASAFQRLRSLQGN